MLEAALDCSQGATLAISRAEALLLETTLPGSGRESDRALAAWLVAQCASLGLSVAQIEGWTVGIGPGSFAGLRCGIALVKGICRSSQARMRGVPSAYALAKGASAGLSAGQSLGVLYDGRCQQFILSRFLLQDDGELSLAEAPSLHRCEDLSSSPDCACDRWVMHSSICASTLPAALHPTLRLLEFVPASQLLSAPGWPWPANPEQTEASCTPWYIRPAVFVRAAARRLAD